MKARRLTYSGRVQGVGFRYSVKQLVTGYDVSGYVRNQPDGTVELWLQGENDEIDAMEKTIAESHLLGFIQEVTADDVMPDALIKGFQIQ
jgi:acylphosphatase